MFRIEMLPAEQGDALFIEYGKASDPHRVLIDGGVRKTSEIVKARIEKVPPKKRRFDLGIVTHVDSDHIGGIPRLFADTTLGFEFDDVWFNGWKHLADTLGPIEGELFSVQLERGGYPWNAAFDGKAVVVPPTGPLPRRELPGGMTLTLLSPTPKRLEKLREDWEQVVKEAGLQPGVRDEALVEAARKRGIPDLLGEGTLDVETLAASKLQPDKAPANGSTIAVLAEYDGVSCLLTGDSHPDVLQAGLQRLCKERGVERIAVDALKEPHHGSMFNVSSPLLQFVETERYLFSTNGRQTEHPHPPAVARTIMRGGSPKLLFNYRVKTTARWDDRRLTSRYRYAPVYPETGALGLTVEL